MGSDEAAAQRSAGRQSDHGAGVSRSYNSPEGRAYRELTECIREQREERRKKFDEVGSRYDELARQHRELTEQLNRAVQSR